MKASQVVSAVGNIAVVAIIGMYLYSKRHVAPQSSGTSPFGIEVVEMGPDEWRMLVEDAPTIGTVGRAPILVEFIDYQCPYCVTSQRLLDRNVLEKGMAIAIRHFPLTVHSAAEGAARAAICAQTLDRF